MTELNEYECEMLDAMLEAFGIPDSLTRNQLLELFDQDEATAYALVQVLTKEGLIAETGKHGPYDLPEKLVLKPRGEQFLKSGGFVKRYKLDRQKPVEVNSTASKLQQQNMKLQNEKLLHRSKITDLEKRIADLKRLQYVWWALIIIAALLFYHFGHSAGLKAGRH